MRKGIGHVARVHAAHGGRHDCLIRKVEGAEQILLSAGRRTEGAGDARRVRALRWAHHWMRGRAVGLSPALSLFTGLAVPDRAATESRLAVERVSALDL